MLTAGVPRGSCEDVRPGEVYETDLAVVLIGRTEARRLPAGQACDLALRVTPVEFRLARPLGARVVLGLDDGRPQTLPADR
ncbi:hypothetical protein [Kitasatospora cheerisanensis]|uniref:Uncharacterized protein n=1 Tax=Kitasatospora cheerisanensis KCTC 2395 TaxID=1348663 RepID=A0A066Z1Z7_9ACTN|nr:hypothetical protein [Kitasatospora cheerisanensis]KDN86254.1 hypothetical protein KCH_20710 [Kitasatospora cheerisanensis KCTC 2395]